MMTSAKECNEIPTLLFIQLLLYWLTAIALVKIDKCKCKKFLKINCWIIKTISCSKEKRKSVATFLSSQIYDD